jgi:hypothetical protein
MVNGYRTHSPNLVAAESCSHETPSCGPASRIVGRSAEQQQRVPGGRLGGLGRLGRAKGGQKAGSGRQRWAGRVKSRSDVRGTLGTRPKVVPVGGGAVVLLVPLVLLVRQVSIAVDTADRCLIAAGPNEIGRGRRVQRLDGEEGRG